MLQNQTVTHTSAQNSLFSISRGSVETHTKHVHFYKYFGNEATRGKKRQKTRTVILKPVILHWTIAVKLQTTLHYLHILNKINKTISCRCNMTI